MSRRHSTRAAYRHAAIQGWNRSCLPSGRAAIAAVILNCEQDRCLDVDWYEELLDQIAPTPEALKPGSLSVVTFNYDRSFERYFSTALASQFNLDAEAAAELFQRIEIEHVYGSLGPLEKIPYGEIDSVKDAAKQIDLMRAGANHARAKRINELIAAASNVCFLGFSFADENLALFKQGSFAKKNVLVATALGLPQKRMAAAKRLIPRIKFHDMSILTLLNQEDVFRAPKTARITPSSPTRPKRSTWAGGGTFWSA